MLTPSSGLCLSMQRVEFVGWDSQALLFDCSYGSLYSLVLGVALQVARFISHKPSVEEIRDDYPGVTVLKGVDFSRIPALLLEMQEMMDYKYVNFFFEESL